MIGFVREGPANCGWFESEKWPDGPHRLHYKDDAGQWVNYACANERPHYDRLDGLVIEKKDGVCNLGALTFRRQCDG